MSLTTTVKLIKIDASFNIAGGMSCLKNLYASNFISQATPSSVGLYSTSVSGIIWKNTYNMGLQNTNNTRIGMAINIASRDNGFKASTFAGDVDSNNPPFYFAYAQPGVQTLAHVISFYSSKVVVANNIECSGGMGVFENMNVGGTVSFSNDIIKTTPLIITDGLNQGTIQQSATELTLSSTGNKVSIGTNTNNQFVFKGATSASDTYQLTAYTGRNVIDNVYTHSYISDYDIEKQTANITTTVGESWIRISSRILYFSNIGTLFKDQSIAGCFFYSITGSSGPAKMGNFGLYISSTGELVASSLTNITGIGGWNYVRFETTYVAPTTQNYHICILFLDTFGPFFYLDFYSCNSNYINYGFDSSSTSLTKNSQLSTQTITTLPSNASGINFIKNDFNIFCGLWRNFRLNQDPALVYYFPFDDDYVNNYNKYYIDGSLTNVFQSTNIGTGTPVLLISSTTRIVGKSGLRFDTCGVNYNSVTLNNDYFSFTFWAYSQSGSPQLQRFVSLSRTGGGYLVMQSQTNAPGIYRLQADATYYKYNSSLVAANAYNNVWVFFAVVVDGTQQYLYRNGSLFTGSTFTRNLIGGESSFDITIGTTSSSDTAGNLSIVDDFRLYNRALSPDEINSIYSYR